MPTVLIIDGFRFFFYSNENSEPVHIHIEKANATAKFWLEPVIISYNYGFTSRELKQIESIIEERVEIFINKWNAYFTK